MSRRAASLAAVASLLAVVAGSGTAVGPTASAAAHARVARVIDGDTIVLESGLHVRLLQIDTPEPGTGECFSRAAGRELRSLLPAGAAVTLAADPLLDEVDRYGRLLRYVLSGGLNLNLELVRRGAATVWFYDGARGRYAARLLAAGTAARQARRGLWGACPQAVWDPLAPASTGPGAPSPSQPRPVAGAAATRRTRPSASRLRHPTWIAPTSRTDFRVRPPDPHHFDGGGDGLGCER